MRIFLRKIADPDDNPDIVLDALKRFLADYLFDQKSYVGISVNPEERTRGHKKTRSWANYMTVLWWSYNRREVEKIEQCLNIHYLDEFRILLAPELMDNKSTHLQGSVARSPRFLYLLTSIDPRRYGDLSKEFQDFRFE